MANGEHLKLLRKGGSCWNEWCGKHENIPADLRDADLANVDLSHTHLFRADLSRANLYGANLNHTTLLLANLHNADLRSADLSGANLRSADLSGARLNVADLSGADLEGARMDNAQLNFANLGYTRLCGASFRGVNLSNARLSDANLDEADLREVTIQGTIFANVDLRTVRGLAEIIHAGPSPVALYTVQLPQDGSMLHFLRGAGVPDEWIDDYRARMMYPIQYHSLFISYSGKDDILARRLHADLQAHGVRCWFAPEDMKIGDRFHSRIDEAIHVQDKLLLLLSESAIHSDWVEIEVRAALEKEQRQHRDVLFPIRLDSSVLETAQTWAAMLRRSRHMGDFTSWTDQQAYQTAFDRLLRDLKKADREEIEDGRFDGKPGIP